MQRKVEPRMQLANFVAEPSVDAALHEQQYTFWDVPSWGNPKQEYKHVLISTKKDDDRSGAFKFAQKAIGYAWKRKIQVG